MPGAFDWVAGDGTAHGAVNSVAVHDGLAALAVEAASQVDDVSFVRSP
jgi:hypothetical protein